MKSNAKRNERHPTIPVVDPDASGYDVFDPMEIAPQDIGRRPTTIGVVRRHPRAVMPARASDEASCFDLCACVDRPVAIGPLKVEAIPVGIALAMPPGWEAQIRPRSGLAMKERITVLNTPGTIDRDYTGEIQVILMNLGPSFFLVKPGDRIAQIKFQFCPTCELVEQDAAPETDRGDAGFGSTGI